MLHLNPHTGKYETYEDAIERTSKTIKNLSSHLAIKSLQVCDLKRIVHEQAAVIKSLRGED